MAAIAMAASANHISSLSSASIRSHLNYPSSNLRFSSMYLPKNTRPLYLCFSSSPSPSPSSSSSFSFYFSVSISVSVSYSSSFEKNNSSTISAEEAEADTAAKTDEQSPVPPERKVQDETNRLYEKFVLLEAQTGKDRLWNKLLYMVECENNQPPEKFLLLRSKEEAPTGKIRLLNKLLDMILEKLMFDVDAYKVLDAYKYVKELGLTGGRVMKFPNDKVLEAIEYLKTHVTRFGLSMSAGVAEIWESTVDWVKKLPPATYFEEQVEIMRHNFGVHVVDWKHQLLKTTAGRCLVLIITTASIACLIWLQRRTVLQFLQALHPVIETLNKYAPAIRLLMDLAAKIGVWIIWLKDQLSR